MHRILIVCGCLLMLSGCGFLFGREDDPTTPQDESTSGLVGTLESGAGVAAAAGVPWAGVAKIGLGLLGTIGGFFVGGRRKKKNAQDFVKLLDELKIKASGLKNDKDLERVILDYAKNNPKFGGYLAKIHARLKGRG